MGIPGRGHILGRVDHIRRSHSVAAGRLIQGWEPSAAAYNKFSGFSWHSPLWASWEERYFRKFLAHSGKKPFSLSHQLMCSDSALSCFHHRYSLQTLSWSQWWWVHILVLQGERVGFPVASFREFVQTVSQSVQIGLWRSYCFVYMLITDLFRPFWLLPQDQQSVSWGHVLFQKHLAQTLVFSMNFPEGWRTGDEAWKAASVSCH